MKDSEFFVDELIHERGLRYGHPARFFRQLSKAWSGVADIDLTPQQCVVMMKIFKDIRMFNNTDDDDTQKDSKGYLKILEMLNDNGV
tara:strand:+ start:96 stop:356 length:261 start_codon:yes stop_codon:yes gene_type:complete